MLFEDFSNIVTIRDVVVCPKGGKNLDITYNPNCATPAMLEKLSSIENTSVTNQAVEYIMELGIGWNVEQLVTDDAGGEKLIPLPLTADVIMKTPMKILNKIVEAVQSDMTPSSKSEAV